MLIPKYTEYGCEVSPGFRNRTLDMLAGWFGYDREELEAMCLEYERLAAEDGDDPVEGFDHFLSQAIEFDLGIEPKKMKA